MSKDKFTEEINRLLENFEPEPPAQVWQYISFRLSFRNLLFGASGLFLVGLLSVAFLMKPEAPKVLTVAQSTLPDRIIVMIDSSYCEDGTIRLDTVYQDLPSSDETPLPAPEILDSSIVEANMDMDWMIGHSILIDSLSYKRGKILYRNYCATCHITEKDRPLTGPSLYKVNERREREWLHDFTRQSGKMIEAGDPQAVALWDAWKPTVMNNFPNLKEKELNDIYYYIEQWEIGD
ncbi:MAG: cytochrome c [Bacteroidota bacterium]